MLWVIFPIFSQLFYTSGGYIQNYLADMAMPKKRAGALIIGRLPCFLMTLLLLFAVFGRAVFIMPFDNAMGLILAGAINIFGSILHFKALQLGDTADVNIFSQLSPLVSLGLGVLILGETITAMQGFGLLLIMLATLVIVFGGMSKKDRQSPNLKVATLTIIATFFSVASDIVFAYFSKGFIKDITFLGRSLFFFEIGSALMTIILLICCSSWRKAIKTAFFTGRNRARNGAACLADNITFMIAEFVYKYGLLVVPVVAMMTAVGKVAGIFVSFFYTLCLGRVFPKFIHGKRITKKVVSQYMIATVLIVVGVIMMN